MPESGTHFLVSADERAGQLPENVNVIELSPNNIVQFQRGEARVYGSSNLPEARSSWQYNIGVGDVLSITVWDHPELTLPAGPERSQLESGSTVNENGDIFYPYIDQIHVAGRAVGDVQRELTERLAEFIPEPQVEVKIAAFNAQKVVVTGAVVAPKSLPVTNIPLSLLEAINGAGGLTEQADDRRVSIRRHGQNHFINLADFLETGRTGSNPILRGGDIVNVPSVEPQQAFLLGQIVDPGIVDFGSEGTSLTEAIASRGGLDETRADAQGVFVFRNRQENIDVFQLDATSPLAFVLATRFFLQADDVVYIVADPAARWNQIIEQLVPTVGAIRQAQLIGNDL